MMDSLMAYDTGVLVTHVLIVAIASMGNTQWAKNWITGPPGRKFSLLALVILVVNVTAQLSFVPPMLTWGWNLFTLGNAVMQFGHEAIIQGIPKLIDKAMGSKGD